MKTNKISQLLSCAIIIVLVEGLLSVYMWANNPTSIINIHFIVSIIPSVITILILLLYLFVATKDLGHSAMLSEVAKEGVLVRLVSIPKLGVLHARMSVVIEIEGEMRFVRTDSGDFLREDYLYTVMGNTLISAKK